MSAGVSAVLRKLEAFPVEKFAGDVFRVTSLGSDPLAPSGQRRAIGAAVPKRSDRAGPIYELRTRGCTGGSFLLSRSTQSGPGGAKA